MKKRFLGFISAFVLMISMFALLPQGVLRAYALEGNGTKDNPYIVMSYDDLYLLIGSEYSVLNSMSSDFYIKLGANIISEDSKTDYYLKLLTDKPRGVTIDLAGHTLSRVTDTKDSAMFLIGSNVTLSIDDSVGGGKISSTKLNESSWNMFSVTNGGTLIINGGSFIDKSMFLYYENNIYLCPIIRTYSSGNSALSCSVFINGGYFESLVQLINQYYGKIFINGGEFKQRSDISGMSGRFDGIILDGDDYSITSCILSCNTSETAISGDKMKDHMPSSVKVKSDGSFVTLTNKTNAISGKSILIYTPDAIKNISWDGYTLSWKDYINASYYGLQLEKMADNGTDYSVITNIDTSDTSYDLTDIIKANGDGDYRVLMGAHTASGDLISKVTYSTTVKYTKPKVISSVQLTVVEPGKDVNASNTVKVKTSGVDVMSNGQRADSKCIWYDGDTKLSGFDKFEPGKTYRCSFFLKTQDAYTPKNLSSVPVYVNGKKATFMNKHALLTSRYRFEVSFTVPADSYDRKKGDVVKNDKIDNADLLAVKSHIKKIKTLTGEDLWAADVDGNGAVNNTDLIAMKAHIKGVKKLW